MSLNLEDIQQTVIYIPYDGDESDTELTLPSSHLKNDLENGPQLRLDAYKAAWTRCFDRMKFIIAELYSPVVSQVRDCLSTIHSNVLPGLPFPELPVITVTDLSGGAIFLDHLSKLLEPVAEDDDEVPTVVNHLYATDCINLTLTMKNLIGGFVERDTDAPRRRPAASLAPYDLGVLQAWFDAADAPHPNLVVLLHDFEQFDAKVIQDVFYICSLHVSRLPLTFILSLSTPSPASYLQASLTRSTLALIRLYHFAVPSGPEVLDLVLVKTFFDPSFELFLLPGPALLEFIEDHYATHTSSLDVLLTVLQVAHLKHFTTNVFSLLSSATPRISPRPRPQELLFLETLLVQLTSGTSAKGKKNTDDWRARMASPTILLQAVDTAREAFSRHARRTKLGFNLLNIVVVFLRERGLKYKLLEQWKGPVAMSKTLDGNGVAGLADLLKKHSTVELNELLGELHAYLYGLPEGIRIAETAARANILNLKNSSSASPAEIGGSLESYLERGFAATAGGFDAALERVVYWSCTVPLINPALRPSVISGMSFPQSYTGQEGAEGEENEEYLKELPDTSILFKGYTKAGKMINVYDWFDNFRMVLEGQRESELAKTAKGKAKGKGKKVEQGDSDDDEKWKLSVQARFIRSLHELDYLGFIKHTSRAEVDAKGNMC
ncbi:origin recognition complex subunit 3 N-terminus-domain-containing protein [Mycena crocata]|nr:origin recognition complex subunit 3 N-terminus-domain-containing protein [Mycena crocata]